MDDFVDFWFENCQSSWCHAESESRAVLFPDKPVFSRLSARLLDLEKAPVQQSYSESCPWLFSVQQVSKR